jgi:hypothetical protein
MLDTLSPRLKKKVTKRLKPDGLKDPVITLTDALEDVLKEKTGSNENEISKLSKEAYGWGHVLYHGNNYSPKIVIDPMKDDPKARNPILHQDRNLRFGVMVYTTHDLFVNLFKHEKGKPSLKWYDDIPADEQKKITVQMAVVVDFISRLIEASEEYQP